MHIIGSYDVTACASVGDSAPEKQSPSTAPQGMYSREYATAS